MSRPRPSIIGAHELLARIEAGGAPPIVDVRSRWEFERGHVPGALHLPFWLAPGRASRIPAARDEPVVVYCGHGPRASLARLLLRLSGFRHVALLAGHMAGWKRAGLPQQTGAVSRHP